MRAGTIAHKQLQRLHDLALVGQEPVAVAVGVILRDFSPFAQIMDQLELRLGDSAPIW